MAEITQMLADARGGDTNALDRVFEAIYPELRSIAVARLAGLSAGHTITPTALVNETYLKLSQAQKLELVDRRHFYVCASRGMRQILIDHHRASSAQRRGGVQRQITLTDSFNVSEAPAVDLLDLEAALGDLAEIDRDLHDLVELKFFGGLSMPELAELMQRSLRTVNRDWARARAFLHTQLA